VALRQAGRAAAPARDALLAALADDEAGVRMIAAQAIGRLGRQCRHEEHRIS
jgi:hypothetical protein